MVPMLVVGIVLTIFFGVDFIVGVFIKGLSNLPTSFTEWWCFPFYISILNPLVSNGFGMAKASIFRVIEFIGIVVGIILIVLGVA